MLSEEGYKPIVAADALQAVMYAQREQPDLIILDIMLPAGGGYEVAKKLRLSTNTHFIPIIVFSALDINEVREKVAPYDIHFFIEKPNTQELIEQVNSMMRRE
jgi:DNA-binding response OmpR family regulator